MQAILKLTRWREFVPFTLPLSLLGGLFAHRFADDVTLDWRLLAILAANCLAMSYAFMINDIEDAEDDKHSAPERAARNAIASGDLTKRTAWMVSLGVAGLAALLYALGGLATFITGLVILALAHLYSWKPVRLKSIPLLDILSHVLFLAALLMLAPYLVYTQTLTPEIWAMMLSAALFSAYGQFYNQTRDYEADQAAGIKNTASLLGKNGTQVLSYIAIPVAVISLVYVIAQGAFPLWLALVGLVAMPVARLVARGRDMRGDEATDAVGDVQVQFLLVVNSILFVWYLVVLAR